VTYTKLFYLLEVASFCCVAQKLVVITYPIRFAKRQAFEAVIIPTLALTRNI